MRLGFGEPLRWLGCGVSLDVAKARTGWKRKGTLRRVEDVDIRAIQKHLEAKRAGLRFNGHRMPSDPAALQGARVILGAADESCLILWETLYQHTSQSSGKLTDLLPSA